MTKQAVTWSQFERACRALWGDAWRAEFIRLARCTDRTLRRWKAANAVKGSAVVPMLDALGKLKAAGKRLP